MLSWFATSWSDLLSYHCLRASVSAIESSPTHLAIKSSTSFKPRVKIPSNVLNVDELELKVDGIFWKA